MTFLEGLTWFLMFIPIIAFHEAAHAWAATLVGDDTPKRQGRLTLNPFAHIDLIGTIIIPAVSIFIIRGFALIGWGKPVMVDPRNFQHPVRDDIFVSMAGPASNLVFTFVLFLIGTLFFPVDSEFRLLIAQFGFLSVFLAVFNLLPIPPLDGWHPLRHLLKIPEETAQQYAWMWLLLLLVAINVPAVRFLLLDIASWITEMLALVTFFSVSAV